MNPFEPHDARDFDNPYAPPRSDLVPRSTTPLTAGSLFSPNDMFSGSWPIFNERVGIFLEILWGTYRDQHWPWPRPELSRAAPADINSVNRGVHRGNPVRVWWG